jgi:hypothetical protein
MSADEPVSAWKSLPTTACHECNADAPAGAFCGVCGARLSRQPTGASDGPAWLRLRTYAAAPTEQVLIPSPVGALFPRLPGRSRSAFWVGLITLAVLLVVFAALRWQGPLIGISALGLPMLYLIYLNETDAFADLPIRILALTAVLGVALGAGWAQVTGAIVARTYDDVLGTPMTLSEWLINALAIPLGAMFLMLVPVALARVVRPGSREALDGFVIGMLGALGFVAAGTLYRLAPQFGTALFAHDRPLADFLVVAATQGVAVPLTAAAVAGMVGATLWFTQRTDTGHRSHWYGFTAVTPALVTGVIAYAAMGIIDNAWLPQDIEAGLYVLIALLALSMLRLVLHSTLLHEVPDETEPDTSVLCPQCDHVVPDLAFCPNCGVAAHAASRSSRHARRANRPVATPEGR